ncbi:MAG: hypothetical protein QM497_02500 [Sulfurimonas sp.]
MLDNEVIRKFKEFQYQTGKYRDLDIENIRFEKVSLSDADYFKFVKGKNKYIQRYITKNSGEYPILGSSLKNSCISAYIKYIDADDIIEERCVSFNKDNGKGSIPFYRDHPFLMDRHHIAIIPTILVDAEYLQKSLIRYFENKKFGWGDNVATVDEVCKHLVPVPKNLNNKYTSIEIQKIIVEFLEDGFNWLDGIKANIDKQNNIYKRLQKSLIPSIFKRDYIKVRFAKYAKKHSIGFDITDIDFEKKSFEGYLNVIKGKSIYTTKYLRSHNGDYPVYSSNTDKITKGVFGKIDSYDYDTESIQFTSNGEKAGTIFFLEKHKFSMNGDRGMFDLKVDNINILYIYFNLKNEFRKHKFSWANKPSNTKIKAQIKIFIPNSLEKYTSYEIQKIIADFINEVDDEIQKSLDKIEKAYDGITRYKKIYLARTFSLIDWSK